MTGYSRGDVALAPYPIGDRLSVRKRPAVAVGANSHRGKAPAGCSSVTDSGLRWPGTKNLRGEHIFETLQQIHAIFDHRCTRSRSLRTIAR